MLTSKCFSLSQTRPGIAGGGKKGPRKAPEMSEMPIQIRVLKHPQPIPEVLTS
jgi:hypothetical protein